MAGLGDRGISDVLSIAFIFVVMVFAGVLLHGFALAPLGSAADRQLSIKTEHLYKTLEFSHVESYALSFFSAIAENLVLKQPTVPGDHLRASLENALEYLRPPDHAVLVQVTEYDNEDIKWVQVYPSDVEPPSAAEEKFVFKGVVTLIKAEAGENRVVRKNVEIVIFKP